MHCLFYKELEIKDASYCPFFAHRNKWLGVEKNTVKELYKVHSPSTCPGGVDPLLFRFFMTPPYQINPLEKGFLTPSLDFGFLTDDVFFF